MKILVGCVIGVIGSAIAIFFDIKLVKWIFTLIPASEWAGLVKIGVVFVDFWLTAGLCVIPFALGLMIGTILENR
ncbi:MAG: hypothetical protein WC554_16660 [Clostridia bacterium]|jgi:hypothetical protein